MKDSKFLRALDLKSNTIPPVWFMRQAGRYLPEYQKIRKNYSNFLDMCKEPKTCAELALQPIERFNLDASILFSDIISSSDLQLFSDGTNDIVTITSQSTTPVMINPAGVITLDNFQYTPTPVEGGLLYSGSDFYLGLE